MIQKLEISGVHMDVDKKLHEYTLKKIGKLDHYLPKAARESAHAEVFLKEITTKKKKERMCEVVLYLPHETITVKESTINMYAAVDIVEAKLRNCIKKYKDTHSAAYGRRLIMRLKRT